MVTTVSIPEGEKVSETTMVLANAIVAFFDAGHAVAQDGDSITVSYAWGGSDTYTPVELINAALNNAL